MSQTRSAPAPDLDADSVPGPTPVPTPATTCGATTGEVCGLTAERAHDAAGTFKALADPARLRLLASVAAASDGSACICDLTEPLALSQPTVSHHMKMLVDAGLVTREQRGRRAHYAIRPGARDLVLQALDATLPLTPSPTATDTEPDPY